MIAFSVTVWPSDQMTGCVATTTTHNKRRKAPGNGNEWRANKMDFGRQNNTNLRCQRLTRAAPCLFFRGIPVEMSSNSRGYTKCPRSSRLRSRLTSETDPGTFNTVTQLRSEVIGLYQWNRRALFYLNIK